MKILIVDDDRLIRTLLTRILTDAGYEVCSASNAAAAEHSAILERPDVVLIDIQLGPGINGVELARRLPAGLPKVFMSGVYSSTEIHEMAAGHKDNPNVSPLCLGKPVSPVLLLAAIQDAASRGKVKP